MQEEANSSVHRPELNARKLAMCFSSSPSEYHNLLHSSIPCSVIYSKEYGHGTLYGLNLSNPTSHKTLDKKIIDLDNMLMQSGSGSTSTRFTSISRVLGGKIKTFSTGEHMIDEHYKAIYASNHPGGGRELVVHPDVVRWVPPLHHVAVLSQEDQSKGTTFQEDDHTIITKLEAESVAKDVRIAELEHKFAMAADDEAVQAVVDVNSNVLQVGDYKRSVWIISYGASCPDLDASKIEDFKHAQLKVQLKVDECYTTTDRDLKYTLVHLEEPIRESVMKRVMTYCLVGYSIRSKEFFGYSFLDGLGVSKELCESPGFKVLHQHMVESNPAFSIWIKNHEARRGGIVKRYVNHHQEIGVDKCDKDELVEVVGEQLLRIKDDARQLKKLTTRVEGLVTENKAKSAELVKKEREYFKDSYERIKSKDDFIMGIQRESNAKDANISELKRVKVIEIAAKDAIIARLNGESAAMVKRLQGESAAKDVIIAGLTAASIAEGRGNWPTIAELEAASAEKDARITRLQQKYDTGMAAKDEAFQTAKIAASKSRNEVFVSYQKMKEAKEKAETSDSAAVAKLKQIEQVSEKETAANANQIRELRSQLGAYQADYNKQLEEIKQLKEAAITPVMRDQSEEIVRLKGEVQTFKNCAMSNHKIIMELEDEVKSLKSRGYVQQSSGGAFFTKVVSIMNAAASVMDWRIEWDRVGCEQLVTGLVEPMVAVSTSNRTNAVRTMVVQLMTPVQRLVEAFVEERRMRVENGVLADTLAAGGCHPPVGKKVKRGGGH